MLLARTLGGVGAALRASDDRVHMRDALRTALGDATTDLLFRDPDTDGWRDARGRPIQGPREPVPDRAVTAIDTGDGRHDIALVHDVALLDDRELLDGVSGMVLANWRHERLTADLGQAMTDLDESRRRIAEAADLERARIERDLHDGAQQRLIALRIRLGLAEELLKTDPGAGVRGGPRARVRGRTRARRAALPRPRRLPAAADRQGPARRAALRRRAGPDARPRRRGRRLAAPDRDRERRLLHLRRGAAERGQARRRRHRQSGSSSARRAPACASRSATTGPGSRSRTTTDADCATCTTASRPSAVRSRSRPSPDTARASLAPSSSLRFHGVSPDEDRFVAPFYLAMMGTNAIEHAEADLLRRVVAVGRDASVVDVVWLLRGAWRPRVMGAWFSLLHDSEAVTRAVLQSLETSRGITDRAAACGCCRPACGPRGPERAGRVRRAGRPPRLGFGGVRRRGDGTSRSASADGAIATAQKRL